MYRLSVILSFVCDYNVPSSRVRTPDLLSKMSTYYESGFSRCLSLHFFSSVQNFLILFFQHHEKSVMEFHKILEDY